MSTHTHLFTYDTSGVTHTHTHTQNDGTSTAASKRGVERFRDFQIMASKRLGLFCGRTLYTKWDQITDPICRTAGVSVWQKGYLCLSNPEPKLLKADVQHSLSSPPPRPSLRLPCSFFIIIGQQIKTKWESAFVVETTESPSDLQTGGLLSLSLSLGVSVWLSVSRCLYSYSILALHLEVALSVARTKGLEKPGLV